MSSTAISIMFACIWITMLCMLLFSNQRARQWEDKFNKSLDLFDETFVMVESLQVQIDGLKRRNRAIEVKHDALLGLLPDPETEIIYGGE